MMTITMKSINWLIYLFKIKATRIPPFSSKLLILAWSSMVAISSQQELSPRLSLLQVVMLSQAKCSRSSRLLTIRLNQWSRWLQSIIKLQPLLFHHRSTKSSNNRLLKYIKLRKLLSSQMFRLSKKWSKVSLYLKGKRMPIHISINQSPWKSPVTLQILASLSKATKLQLNSLRTLCIELFLYQVEEFLLLEELKTLMVSRLLKILMKLLMASSTKWLACGFQGQHLVLQFIQISLRSSLLEAD